MILKVLIISVIIMALVMLGLGVKMLFNRNAEFTVPTCSLKDGELDEDGACAKCQLKDLADCPENKIKKNKKS
jgi:hypothetical protein